MDTNMDLMVLRREGLMEGGTDQQQGWLEGWLLLELCSLGHFQGSTWTQLMFFSNTGLIP